MKLFLKTLLVVCFIGVFAVAANAFSGAMDGRPALVTIRFNQQQVSYQNQLFNAVVAAVKVKPSVVFYVVGSAPMSNDPDKAAKLLTNTQYYTGKVADDLAKMGVNPQQIRSNIEKSAQVRDEEVRVFVE